MAGSPFTVCRNCGSVALFDQIHLGASNRLAYSEISTQCLKCGGEATAPPGTWTGTDRGVLFEPFELSVGDLQVVFEIIQHAPDDKKYSAQELRDLDRRFERKTGTGKKPFTRFAQWSRSRTAGTLKTTFRVFGWVIAVLSGSMALTGWTPPWIDGYVDPAIAARIRADVENIQLQISKEPPDSPVTPPPPPQETHPGTPKSPPHDGPKKYPW